MSHYLLVTPVESAGTERIAVMAAHLLRTGHDVMVVVESGLVSRFRDLGATVISVHDGIDVPSPELAERQFPQIPWYRMSGERAQQVYNVLLNDTTRIVFVIDDIRPASESLLG